MKVGCLQNKDLGENIADILSYSSLLLHKIMTCFVISEWYKIFLHMFSSEQNDRLTTL